MKKACLLSLAVCNLTLFAGAQVPGHIVISQVYGGGGNTGAQFRNDFVELYNPTGATVSLSGWSLQYAANGSANWNPNNVPLSGNIDPGSYLLIQLAGGANGVALPLPELSSAGINIAAGGGKLALVNTITPLTGTCPKSNPSIVDFIGYGSGADCFEGTVGGGPITGNTSAIFRKNNGCADTDNNAADLMELAPAPRNGGAPAHSCATVISIGTVAPVPFCVTSASGFAATVGYTVSGVLPASLSVYLSDATGSLFNALLVGSTNTVQATGSIAVTIPPALSGATQYRLRADGNNAFGEVSNTIELINGAKNVASVAAFPDQAEASVQWTFPSGCFDEFLVVCKQDAAITRLPSGDGSAYAANSDFAGAGTPFDGGKVVCKNSGSSVLVTGLTLGATYFFKVFTRRGTSWSTGVETGVATRIIPAPGDILINSFSPRYNQAADEYYELVNRTGKTFNLTDVALQYQSATGGTRLPLNLGGTLPPHSFWLLAPGAGSVTIGKTNNLPSEGSSGAGVADAGYIGLLRRKDNALIDAVAYGNVSNGTFIEGTALPALPGQVGAYRRRTDGGDNNNNAADFEAIAATDIDLRNSNSRLANSGAAIPAGNYRRLYVTGNSSIAGMVSLSEKLVLGSGQISLHSFGLGTAAIEGGSTVSYVRTNGAGSLQANSIGAGAFLFPVGNSSYNPLTLANGSNLQWQVRVGDAVPATGSDRAVLRTWTIAPSGIPPLGAALTFQYNESDATQLGANFTSTDGLQVWHKGGGTWQKAGPVVLPGGTPGGMRTVGLTNWFDFSEFVVAGASAVLPVRFGPLRLVESGQGPTMFFTTYNQLDIAWYVVQTAADGLRFTDLHRITPGRDGVSGSYQYTDSRKDISSLFYRIKAVGTDGKEWFSTVAFWHGGQGSGMQVYTNGGNRLHYQLADLAKGSYQLRVIDAAGRIVKRQLLQHHGGMLQGSLGIQEAAAGWHLLQLFGPQLRQKTLLIHR